MRDARRVRGPRLGVGDRARPRLRRAGGARAGAGARASRAHRASAPSTARSRRARERRRPLAPDAARAAGGGSRRNGREDHAIRRRRRADASHSAQAAAQPAAEDARAEPCAGDVSRRSRCECEEPTALSVPRSSRGSMGRKQFASSEPEYASWGEAIKAYQTTHTTRAFPDDAYAKPARARRYAKSRARGRVQPGAADVHRRRPRGGGARRRGLVARHAAQPRARRADRARVAVQHPDDGRQAPGLARRRGGGGGGGGAEGAPAAVGAPRDAHLPPPARQLLPVQHRERAAALGAPLRAARAAAEAPSTSRRRRRCSARRW